MVDERRRVNSYLEPLVSQVKAEEDPLRAIQSLADVIVIMDTQQSGVLTRIHDRIDDLNKVIKGNGEIASSVLGRMTYLEKILPLIIKGGVVAIGFIFSVFGFIVSAVGGWLILKFLNLI